MYRVFLCMVAISTPSVGHGDTQTRPSSPPELSTTRLSVAPKVDGNVLGDDAWSGLYLVYNEVNERGIGALPTGREFILKYSHILDVFN